MQRRSASESGTAAGSTLRETVGLYDDFDFVVPMVSPVCRGDLAWRLLSKSRSSGDEAGSTFSLEEMRTAFWIHSPLAHPLRVPRRRALIVTGRGDRVVPPEHSHALWQHWGRPAIHWFGGSHLANLENVYAVWG